MTETATVSQIPTDRRERIAWYLFDFANTSFTVLMVTALFPIFLFLVDKKHLLFLLHE